MPDIAKCHGDDCEIKERCYRYTSQTCDLQWWIAPFITGSECMYFYSDEKQRS